jgi:phosphoribosylamine--glycine ligase
MNILLIGSGGREHALAKGLKQSASCDLLFALPGNPGILTLAQKVTNCSLNDPKTIISFCKRNAIELVVIGPDAPLVKGLADI